MNASARTILAVAVAAALSLPAWAGWYQDYTAGKKDFERGRWDAAARLFQRAISDKPASELQARTSGMWREDYLPHFYLGMCYLRLGDLERAEAELRKEERAGAIAGRADLAAQMRQGLAEIGEKRAAAAPAPAPPPVASPTGTPAPVPAPTQPSPQAPAVSKPPSTPATTPSKAPIRPPPAPAPIIKPPPAAPAPKPLPVPATPAPRPTPPSSSTGLDAQMKESVLEGFRLAEQGFYAKAAEAISTAAGDRGEDAKLAALLKAYSGSFFYNAYLLSNPPDDVLRERAHESFLAAVRLDPALTLPERYFSPRVVSFFEGVRSSAGSR